MSNDVLLEIDCLCHSHKLTVEKFDNIVSLVYWSRTRGDWMGWWDRIKKAWQILRSGSAVLDDIEIGTSKELRALGIVFLQCANEVLIAEEHDKEQLLEWARRIVAAEEDLKQKED